LFVSVVLEEDVFSPVAFNGVPAPLMAPVVICGQAARKSRPAKGRRRKVWRKGVIILIISIHNYRRERTKELPGGFSG
jgi:hypothetical protein